MGTALSDEHVKLFKKLDVEIRLCLDSDEAGKSATIKAMGKLYENDIKFKIVHPLDDAKDVDEYLNAFGKDNLNLKLNPLDEPILYSLDYYIKHNYLNSYENKEKFLLFNKKNLLELSSLAKSEILNRLATDLNVQESSIEKLIYGSSSPVKKKTFVYNKDSNKDVSLKIKDFILANNSLRNDDAILVSKLVLLESKILVRIVKNVDFFNMKDYCKSEYRDFMSDASFDHECCVNIGEIMGGKIIKNIVALQVVNNKGYARAGMVIMDKNCKVYYLGHTRKEGLCCKGIPGEFIGNI